MAQRFKNKITVYFDKEQTQSMRVFLHTLEQTNVFIQFIRRCTVLPYIAYTQESYKNGVWRQVNTQEFDIAGDYAESRAHAAPYKMDINLISNKKAAFTFSTYYFSSLDIDYFTNLINNGTHPADVSFTTYVRNRETDEWMLYAWGKSIPHNIATTYLSLSSESKDQANGFIDRLTRV